MKPPPDDRSPLALGFAWASRITAVAMEMVAPGLLGWWLDSYLGTKVVFMLLGFAGGMCLGFWHLLRMAAGPGGEDDQQR